MTEPLSADIDLIQRIIPHRYPFLLVDKVTEIHGTERCVGIKNVTMNEPQFTGHFPGTPIFPGVMIIEAMAQTAGVLIGTALGIRDQELLIYFTTIDKCKFRRKVVPGDRMEMEVTTIRGRKGSKIWRFAGRTMVDGELAAEAEFAAVVDFDWTALE